MPELNFFGNFKWLSVYKGLAKALFANGSLLKDNSDVAK